MNKGQTVFPNLARWTSEDCLKNPTEGDRDVFTEVDREVKAELESAGIKPEGFALCRAGEVPTQYKGFIHKWTFDRAWYYYRASGSGIPPEFAVPFDKQWGTQVRVNGDCACRGAEFWGEGFAIDSYHIDTVEGLKAFVDMLALIHRPRSR